jgi:two-component system sensor histidine kinase LytS
MGWGRTVFVDLLSLLGVLALGALAIGGIWGLVPQWVTGVTGVVLAVSATAAIWGRMADRPDHVRAMQSHTILEIANESLAHLRQGLTRETAQAVCQLVLSGTEASAVAITDRETVLGFAGLGEDHHTTGGPIITRATRESLETGEHRVLATQEEIGCPKKDCLLKSAIVVPLEMRGATAGTLKFYYTTPRLLNETQVTMVEGLAKLLSTQLELSELDRQTQLATSMELKALQSQINPHFLFNTINTIASLIRTDPPKARELLRDFAAFYRRTLENSDELITLERELEYTRRYVVFERARFGEDRIRVTEDVEAALLGSLVPAFVLQPLVENAVQHGIRSDVPLHITVRARCEAGGILIDVDDDGLGISASDLPRVLEPGFGRGLGIALKNVDDRLRGHFGPGSGLRVTSREGEGTTVRIVIGALPDSSRGGAAC